MSQTGQRACAPGGGTSALILALDRATNVHALEPMAQLLSALLTREPALRRIQRASSVASAAGVGTSPAIQPLLPACLRPVLDPLPEPLLGQILVDLLKHPLCVGEPRHVVLDALGRRSQRLSTDQWDQGEARVPRLPFGQFCGFTRRRRVTISQEHQVLLK
jgi:hypothetical protein